MPATALSRPVLLVDRPASQAATPVVRRYRLARLRLNPPRDPVDRHAHLKRSYD